MTNLGKCVGVQYPCENDATVAITLPDGDDMETARSVTLGYCESCIREAQQIEADAELARIAEQSYLGIIHIHI